MAVPSEAYRKQRMTVWIPGRDTTQRPTGEPSRATND